MYEVEGKTYHICLENLYRISGVQFEDKVLIGTKVLLNRLKKSDAGGMLVIGNSLILYTCLATSKAICIPWNLEISVGESSISSSLFSLRVRLPRYLRCATVGCWSLLESRKLHQRLVIFAIAQAFVY